MRISDWSSDVCSSDLRQSDQHARRLELAADALADDPVLQLVLDGLAMEQDQAGCRTHPADDGVAHRRLARTVRPEPPRPAARGEPHAKTGHRLSTLQIHPDTFGLKHVQNNIIVGKRVATRLKL